MSTFATLPPDERSLFFRQYQQTRGIDPVIVEKDFWVCWLLGRIFSTSELGDTCVFKGGTSLSKVFHAIERFSEDIDVGVSPTSLGMSEADLDEAPSNTLRHKRMKKIEAACGQTVSQRWQPRLEQLAREILGAKPEGGDWLSYRFDEASHSPILLFHYPGALPRGVTYIAREVRIEFGSLTDQRPTGRHRIEPMVAALVPEAFTDFAVDVVALEVERTFWEKATILHAEFHRPAENAIRDRLARHYADFAALWQHESARQARTRFDLLERVRVHKSKFFSSAWANYDAAIPGTLRLVPPPHRIAELRADYDAMRQMFLDDPLDFDELIAILHAAEKTINAS